MGWREGRLSLVSEGLKKRRKKKCIAQQQLPERNSPHVFGSGVWVAFARPSITHQRSATWAAVVRGFG